MDWKKESGENTSTEVNRTKPLLNMPIYRQQQIQDAKFHLSTEQKQYIVSNIELFNRILYKNLYIGEFK